MGSQADSDVVDVVFLQPIIPDLQKALCSLSPILQADLLEHCVDDVAQSLRDVGIVFREDSEPRVTDQGFVPKWVSQLGTFSPLHPCNCWFYSG